MLMTSKGPIERNNCKKMFDSSKGGLEIKQHAKSAYYDWAAIKVGKLR
jgi:hypothetical protein